MAQCLCPRILQEEGRHRIHNIAQDCTRKDPSGLPQQPRLRAVLPGRRRRPRPRRSNLQLKIGRSGQRPCPYHGKDAGRVRAPPFLDLLHEEDRQQSKPRLIRDKCIEVMRTVADVQTLEKLCNSLTGARLTPRFPRRRKSFRSRARGVEGKGVRCPVFTETSFTRGGQLLSRRKLLAPQKMFLPINLRQPLQPAHSSHRYRPFIHRLYWFKKFAGAAV
jgi:hypothetical protein